jgi:hypothetical protein
MRHLIAKATIALLPLALLLASHGSLAQYGGGAGKGDGSSVANSTRLDGSSVRALYSGGVGQGSVVNALFSNGLNGNSAGPVYAGGPGKGDLALARFAQSLSGDNLNVLFAGGGGRGDQAATKSSFALGGQAVDMIYYGGAGRGDTSSVSSFVPLFDCTVQNMWSGKLSTAWEDVANWSCNELPGPNSTVLIPSNVPRYPVVNLSTEIKRIQVDPGASVQVKAGQLLKLNGQ